jgi:hypothetical protein
VATSVAGFSASSCCRNRIRILRSPSRRAPSASDVVQLPPPATRHRLGVQQWDAAAAATGNGGAAEISRLAGPPVHHDRCRCHNDGHAVLVMTDLTTGSGRFNLARGAVGTCTGIAAALSTTVTGVIAARFGRPASFLTAAGVAALAVLLLWLYLPESRPKEYLD